MDQEWSSLKDSFLDAFFHCLCDSPTLDKALGNIPWREGVMFNTRFIYLKMVHVTWHFWFRVIQSLLETQKYT